MLPFCIVFMRYFVDIPSQVYEIECNEFFYIFFNVMTKLEFNQSVDVIYFLEIPVEEEYDDSHEEIP